MRVAVAYNRVDDAGNPDEADVLAQVAAVAAALGRLGHDPCEVACDLDLAGLERTFRSMRPQVVFNLVESLGGHARLIHLVPALLDALRIPYAGASADAIYLTSHKVLAKQRLAAAGLPTPDWIEPRRTDVGQKTTSGWIVKSLWEHASVGLDEEETLLHRTLEDARQAIARQAARFGGEWFAERFVDGREFNLSLLTGSDGLRILPPAEIVFEGYPPDKLRIVGYRAKWDPDSYEYTHTPRRFDFPAQDSSLLEDLKQTASACWRLFGLEGWARVDFRVDAAGRPWVLEVNANPCLSPDAGFAAALTEAGIAFDAAVAAILKAATEGLN